MTDLKLYYAPHTRSFTGLWLMEALGQPYDLESFDLAKQRHKQADYLGLNPMGKVPLMVHRGVAVAELGAIGLYLGDTFPDRMLGVAIDDPQRAAYLRWHFFSSAIMEPAYAQALFSWEAPASTVAWGSFSEMIRVATAGVQSGAWLLGDRFTTADVLVAASLDFGMKFGVVSREGPLGAYVERATARPAFARAAAIEAREGARFPRPAAR